jgi:RHS repeat-associated protein
MIIGSDITHFPSPYYIRFVTPDTTTRHVLLNGRTIADVTGSATTSLPDYVFSDNLGSADVTADSNNRVQEVTDYTPFGAINNHDQLAGYTEERKFTGQKYDSTTNLNYLNARYQDPVRGQFINEDPVFLGSPSQQNLQDPQSLNACSYSEDDPITKEDPLGKDALGDFFYNLVPASEQKSLNQFALNLSNGNPAWNFAINHPYTTAGIVAAGAIPALYSADSAAAALEMAKYPGVGSAFAAQQTFATVVYSALAAKSALQIPDLIGTFAKANPNSPSSYFPVGLTATEHFGPSIIGDAFNGYAGSIYDAYEFAGMLSYTLGSAANNLFSNSVQARTQTAQTFNSAISGRTSGSHPSGGGAPNANSLWVTPSGAVVTFGGQLVSGPTSSK